MRSALSLVVVATLAVSCGGSQRRQESPPQSAPRVADAEPTAPGTTKDTPTTTTAAGPARPGPPFAPPFEGTIGATQVARDGSPVALLAAVRASEQGGYDRIVFEFTGSVPGYHVEYVDKPLRSCGSGEPVPVAGDAWLAVRLTPANAHTEAGQPTVDFRERALQLPVARELQSLCDFEAHVEWAIGVASPNRYRVTELQSPARLVVDIRHTR